MKILSVFLLMLMVFISPSHAFSFVLPDSVGTTSSVAKKSNNKLPTVSSTKKQKFFAKVLAFVHPKKDAEALTDEEVRKANSNATTGFVFSLLGLLVLPLFAIPGLIMSKKALRAEKLQPNTLTRSAYTMAKAARVMGWIGVAIIILLVPLIVLAIALGSWH